MVAYIDRLTDKERRNSVSGHANDVNVGEIVEMSLWLLGQTLRTRLSCRFPKNLHLKGRNKRGHKEIDTNIW